MKKEIELAISFLSYCWSPLLGPDALVACLSSYQRHICSRSCSLLPPADPITQPTSWGDAAGYWFGASLSVTKAKPNVVT